MRKSFTMTLLACVAAGCSEPREAQQVERKQVEAPVPTAMGTIRAAHDSIEADCGRHLREISETAGLDELELAQGDQADADALLAKIGSMAHSCAGYDAPAPGADGCSPDCSWCPLRWQWCVENAGACVGGDKESCCKLGTCGSRRHCEGVCEASCGCDVSPVPADGG